MRRTGLLLGGGVVIAVAALGVGAVRPVPPSASAEIEQLKKEVAGLHQRVASLEEQLKNGSVLVIPKDGKNRPDVINPYPGPHRVPPYWHKFEFNGMPCYIIPIDQICTPAGGIEKQVPPDRTPPASKAADDSVKP